MIEVMDIWSSKLHDAECSITLALLVNIQHQSSTGPVRAARATL